MLRNFIRPAGSAAPGLEVRAEAQRPDPASLARIDAAADRIAPDDERLNDWYANYRAQQRRRLAFDLALVESLADAGARIVDLGAVPPVLDAALRAAGHDVLAVDVAPERFAGAFSKTGVEPLRCDIEREKLPLPDAHAGIVVFHEVFEHLRLDPVFTLSEIARVLAPGGRLLLSTPNLASLDGCANLFLRGRAQTFGTDPFEEFSKLRALGHMGHVREYTTVEVCEFVARFGLRPEALVFRGRSPGRLKGAITRWIPRLRPVFELVARREAVSQSGPGVSGRPKPRVP